MLSALQLLLVQAQRLVRVLYAPQQMLVRTDQEANATEESAMESEMENLDSRERIRRECKGEPAGVWMDVRRAVGREVWRETGRMWREEQRRQGLPWLDGQDARSVPRLDPLRWQAPFGWRAAERACGRHFRSLAAPCLLAVAITRAAVFERPHPRPHPRPFPRVFAAALASPCALVPLLHALHAGYDPQSRLSPRIEI
eukprot:6209489-Pleurochrysis_carterae.AAC.1